MKLDQIGFWSEIKLEIMKREKIYFSDKNRRLRLELLEKGEERNYREV